MGHDPQPQPEMDPDYDPEAAETGDTPDATPEAAPQPSSPPVPSPGVGSLIGQTLEGRYRFEELVGEGSFARVYRVYDLERRVYLAAKVLRSDIAQEPAFLERFKREAAVLARLQHPNIVRYYDIVESGAHVFILTDYIPGRTLQWALRQAEGPITPFDSLAYLQPLAAALHFAHRQGVVHRDLKPANILLDENNQLYVTDFGIARILTESSTLTMDMTVGTPHYMSPEQIMAAEVTEAADVYALGVLLYQMYTGQLPFTGDSPGVSGTTTAVRIAYEHLHVEPTPPTQHNRRLSIAVQDVILRCLAKDPAQRYGSVSEVYEALTDAIGTPSVSLDPVALDGVMEPGQGAEPRAARVPTGVGGLSRVAEAEEYEAEADEEEEDFYFGFDPPGRRKRKAKRAAQAARRDEMRAEFQAEKGAEKEGEKGREKQNSHQEKEDEKGPEKAEFWAEFWGDFGVNDRLSQFTLGGIALWAGLVFMLGFTNAMAWIAGGAGTLLLLEVVARAVSPQMRTRPGARLVVGAALLTLGLGSALSLGSLWPLVLIAIGIALLFNRLTG